MTATWRVVALDYSTSLGGEANVVTSVHWDCSDVDENDNAGRSYGSVAIPTEDLSSFTEYADITETQAVTWAKDALGAESVASIEQNVADQIAEKASPSTGTGVPWA